MPRIPLIARPQDLPAAHQPIFTKIARSRGRVAGPFAALLHSPPVAERTADLGAYIRFESTLRPVDRELAVLAVARERDCRFEWAAHVPEARKAGVSPGAIAAIRARAFDRLGGDEAQIVRYATDLLTKRRVDDATFEAVRRRLGLEGVVELTATVGYYAMLACTLNAFDVRPDSGEEELDVP